MSNGSNTTSDSPAILETMPNPNNAILLKDLSLSYINRSHRLSVLDHVTFSLSPGEFVSLIGPSGCGKSTLLRFLCGLFAERSDVICTGDATVHGSTPSEARRRHKVGIQFQNPALLPWKKVIQNVRLPLELMKSKEQHKGHAQSLLSSLGLRGFEEYYPQALSGGMQQRVALARSLISYPPVLLLDEPFGALDAGTRERLNLHLLSLWSEQKISIVFVTHSIPEAVFLSDRVIVLSSRPGHILLDLPIHLPRPRDLAIKETVEFISLARNVREALEKALSTTSDTKESRAEA